MTITSSETNSAPFSRSVNTASLYAESNYLLWWEGGLDPNARYDISLVNPGLSVSNETSSMGIRETAYIPSSDNNYDEIHNFWESLAAERRKKQLIKGIIVWLHCSPNTELSAKRSV
jgi:hypothetical protein